MRIKLTILPAFLILLISGLTFAQAPLGFNYQGIARSADGSPIISQTVGLRISITSGPNGSSDYIEEHSVTTNEFGLFAIVIGQGQSSGSINNVDWTLGNKWIQVELDVQDNGNYNLVGSQQLMSVPYALFSSQSGSDLEPGVGIDISKGRVTNTLPDQIIGIFGQGSTTVTGAYPNFTIESTDNIDDADADPSNEIQDLSATGVGTDRTINISGGTGATISVADNDNSSTNELNTAGSYVANNTVRITDDGGDVDIPVGTLNANLDAGSNSIQNLANPTNAQDAATKDYVDTNDTNLDTGITANSTAITSEISDRTSGDAALQNELDLTQTGAGLNTDGTYTPDGGASYINAATGLKDADTRLDNQIQLNAVDIATVATNLSNTYAFSAEYDYQNLSGPTTFAVADISSTINFDSFGMLIGNQIRVQEDGIYMFNILGTTEDVIQVSLRVNGNNAQLHQAQKQLKHGDVVYNDNGQFLLNLSAGDYLELIIESSGLGDTGYGTIFGYKL